MRRGWRIARIRGVEVRADASLVLLGALITYNLWLFYSSTDAILPLFWFQIRSASHPLQSGSALALALLTAALFFGSVLAHELAHAAAFRARGIPVRGITLFMFGGYTVGSREAERPSDEFLFAAVGPATTAALGLGFLGLHIATNATGHEALRAMFGYLAALNLFMGAFNLLPGLPLDGGRVLAAILWRITGTRSRATRLASRSGQVVAALITAGGLAELLRAGDLGGVWLLFIGWMLFSSSTAALAQTEQLGLLESAAARDVMSPPPPTVPADISVATALERYLGGREGEAFPVTEDGRVVGFISLRLARDARWDLLVRDVMVGTDGVAIADPWEPMTRVTQRLREREAQVALVVDDGRLVGVIEQEDLARFFRHGRRVARGRAGPQASASGPPPRPDVPGTGGG